MTLQCPLYQSSQLVHISWLYADTYHTPVAVDRTKAISDNGIQRYCNINPLMHKVAKMVT